MIDDSDYEWLSVWQWLTIRHSMRRSLRRHHRERLQKSRAGYWGMKDWGCTPRELGMVVDTPNRCSCWMCGNPRKYNNEITRQERKQILNGGGEV